MYYVDVMKNGIPLIYRKLPNLETMTISVWVSVGSKDENLSNNGISHFIEHLFFDIHGDPKIHEKIEDVGVIMNAATTKEYTYYYIIVEKENFEKAVELLCEMFSRKIREKDIEKEKQIILSEYKTYMSSQKVLVDAFAKALWGDEFLGLPIIGSEQVIKEMTLKQIEDYIDNYYSDERIQIILLGNLPPRSAFAKVNKHLKNLHFYKKDFFLDLSETHVSSNTGVYLQRINSKMLNIAFGFNSYPFGNRKRIVLDLLAQILSSGNRGLLYKILREQHQLCYSVGVNHPSFTDDGAFFAWATIDVENFEKFLIELTKIFKDICLKGIPEKQIEVAKRQLRTTYNVQFQSPFNYIPYIGKHLLSGELFSLNGFYSRIEKISQKDLINVAKEVFDFEHLVMALVGDLSFEEISQAIDKI